MKASKTILTILAALLLYSAQGQQVTESISNLQRNYRPLFGTQASTITVEFLKTYQLDGRDTNYLLVMSVSTVSTEAVGYSVGASVFDLFSGVSVSNNYKLNKSAGRVALDRASFLSLYDCVSRVFKFSAGRAHSGGSENDALCTCGVDGVTFGGEQAGGSKAATFYFRVGEDSMFSMSQAEFTEIMTVMNTAKRRWTLQP